ncbi:50S ribosomal protein L18e [Candidatus Alkanophaga liquidiphilum]|nr:MAG: 50S ribosomal protein L18e [Candidatus Alkanophagales archaeon]
MRRRRRVLSKNVRTVRLIEELKKKAKEEGVALWKDVAERLEKPRRRYAEVNLSKINRYSKDDEIILVPGKVLGSGKLERKVAVAALSFSKSAYESINAVGRCMSIEELMKENPEGSNVRIIA